MPRTKPAISVIIPSYNEEKYIGMLFGALGRQTFSNFETIVVDGNSTDHTREISSKHAKVVTDSSQVIGVARNRGAKIARGDILVFLDADSRPSPDLLEKYYGVFKDRRVVAATCPLVPIERVSDLLGFGFHFATTTLAKTFCGICGANFAVRRDAFMKSGGFDRTLTTYEDVEFAKRLRRYGSIRFENGSSVAVSARRIKKWGIIKFTYFNIDNVVRHALFGRSNSDYERIR